MFCIEQICTQFCIVLYNENCAALIPTLSLARCFERFFQKVNVKEGKFVSKRRMLVMDDLDLIGIDYLWEIALKGSERIVGRAVNLLKQSYTNLGPRLRANQVSALAF